MIVLPEFIVSYRHCRLNGRGIPVEGLLEASSCVNSLPRLKPANSQLQRDRAQNDQSSETSNDDKFKHAQRSDKFASKILRDAAISSTFLSSSKETGDILTLPAKRWRFI